MKLGKKNKDEAKQKPKNWYQDSFETVKIQRNILFVSFAAAMVGVVGLSYIMSELTPLKSVEPFVIRVDDTTGKTIFVRPTKNQDLIYNDEVRRFFIWEYVKARESFSLDTYEENWRQVSLMTKSEILADYKNIFSSSNPENPNIVIGREGAINVQRRYMLFEGNDRVRIGTTISTRKGNLFSKKNVVIELTYEFVDMKLDVDGLYRNPLGFRVNSYNVEIEEKLK